MTDLGAARVHSAEAACAAWRLAWRVSPGFCFVSPEWEAYDALHAVHMVFYHMRQE